MHYAAAATWWPHPTESAACQCTGRPLQINPTGWKKTLFTMAPLNHMHKGHCSYLTILKMAAANSIVILPLPPNKPFDQITSTNTTELAASVNTVDRTVSSNTTDGTAKTLLKLEELMIRNHGHFALVSQRIWTHPSISVSRRGPRSQILTPLPNFPFERRLYRIW